MAHYGRLNVWQHVQVVGLQYPYVQGLGAIILMAAPLLCMNGTL